MRSGRSRSSRTPLNAIAPAAGRTSPDMARTRVLLPAPFAPSSVTMAPFGTSRVTPLRARIAPYATSSSLILRLIVRTTQVRGDDFRMAPHVLGRALRDLAATTHHLEVFAERHHQPHVVVHQQHRYPHLTPDPPNDLREPVSV